MRRSRLIIAIVLALIGLFWLAQGLDVIKGSAMSGTSFWAIVGIVLIALAAVIVARERRLPTRT